MIKVIRQLFLTTRFFLAFGGIVVVFVTGFLLPVFFAVGVGLLLLGTAFTILEGILLFNHRQPLVAGRRMAKILSLHHDNKIELKLVNLTAQDFHIRLIDELPAQLQIRDFREYLTLTAKEKKRLIYLVRPNERGVYAFGQTIAFISVMAGLLERRLSLGESQEVAVYPSIVQMKEFELKAFSRISVYQGIKKMRRLGHSYEFEQIKNYVEGDDFRSINWKASGRRGQLMVNQYEDERAQQVYAIIDKGRSMKLPFNGLSLMDYAINTSLVILNIALKKHDRTGLITFSDRLGNVVKASSKRAQLNYIMEALYRQEHRPLEANFEILFHSVRRLVQGRSLLFLFTNFESRYSMERVLPLLRRLQALHLLVVVFFENTEVADYSREEAEDLLGVYQQTIARKWMMEKQQMVQILQQHGIQTILTRPEELSMHTVNKYLELKARGLI